MTKTLGGGTNPPPPAPQPATPPPASQVLNPEKKKVVAVKVVGQRWAVKFDGRVTRRDISHLTRLLRIEYARSKRKDQLERRKAERAKETAK